MTLNYHNWPTGHNNFYVKVKTSIFYKKDTDQTQILPFPFQWHWTCPNDRHSDRQTNGRMDIHMYIRTDVHMDGPIDGQGDCFIPHKTLFGGGLMNVQDI